MQRSTKTSQQKQSPWHTSTESHHHLNRADLKPFCRAALLAFENCFEKKLMISEKSGSIKEMTPEMARKNPGGMNKAFHAAIDCAIEQDHSLQSFITNNTKTLQNLSSDWDATWKEHKDMLCDHIREFLEGHPWNMKHEDTEDVCIAYYTKLMKACRSVH